MPGEHYRHIFLAGPTRIERFTNPRQGGGAPHIPTRNRGRHSAHLQRRLEAAWREAEQRQAVAHTDRLGVYIDFISEPGFDLTIKSLEKLKSGIRLLNVRKVGADDTLQTMATVYVPRERRGYFLKKINSYANEVDPKTGEPKNSRLINSISDIRRSILESFWLDTPELLPGDTPAWVEVWLSGDRNKVVHRFRTVLQTQLIEGAEGVLRFPERAVMAVLANRAQLTLLIEISDDIAELRRFKEVTSFYIEMENREQAERVRDLLARVRLVETRVAVTILDSGVNNGHALIQPVLADADQHAAVPSWGIHDHAGHGTLMAGTAVYGDLLDVLDSTASVLVPYRLESAKILPPPPERNPKELWGYITAQGLLRAEIQAPDRERIACLAVTSTDSRDRGRPSSWSALIDELSSGYADDIRRLFVVSAGNVFGSHEFSTYPQSNITNEVHDPGQSWNALTVGAETQKSLIADPSLKDYVPIAPPGGLSPFSTTSATWAARTWPLKPDVIFEGGNVARGPNDSIQVADDLQLVSTFFNPQIAQFAPFGQTSAAAAQAARMAAIIQAFYPEAWPETVRALIVHTAQWTETMKAQFLPAQPTKADYARLLRICGYGTPDQERALFSASNSLTLVSQGELQPYEERDGRRVTREMHFYNLPWPLDVLRDLGQTIVSMRVTLSYFVEPGPGEVGWQDRYRYASHALRFEINGPEENDGEFIRRINNQARDDGEHPGTQGPGDRWVIGVARNVGSIHSDIWLGRAADLAASNLIGIYPAVGWWRERHHLGRVNRRARYSLIVSINTPAVNIDIYTPVAIRVGIITPVIVPVA
jgi:hypothetical protein